MTINTQQKKKEKHKIPGECSPVFKRIIAVYYHTSIGQARIYNIYPNVTSEIIMGDGTSTFSTFFLSILGSLKHST